MANEDHVHIALPKLYGAPAYARPPAPVTARAERPFDPDDLPIEAHQTDTDRELAVQFVARPYNGGAQTGALSSGREGFPMLRGRPFRLRTLAGRVLGGDHSNGGQ